MPNSLNLYIPDDDSVIALPGIEKVFISHRNFDKPLAIAVAMLLERLGVHYWFDREDKDTLRAAALGMAGDQALVHAIERGVRHSTQVLGLLSANTLGSWWVPYEIGVSRALDRPVSFLVLESIRSMEALPAYVRLAANYWSVDELVRWAASLSNNTTPTSVEEDLIERLEKESVPRQPPTVTLRELSTRALTTIDRLGKPETWEGLRLSSTEHFDWLPTRGGLVRDLVYDLLSPLAYFLLNVHEPVYPEQRLLRMIYQANTLHYQLAALSPSLTYHPREEGWRQIRYITPASSWLQGLTVEQLGERLNRYFFVMDLNHNRRLATREEFKAVFDWTLKTNVEHERRSLGVLINPLFGFTPIDRPVYLRVLVLQQRFYEAILNQAPRAIFDTITNSVVDNFITQTGLFPN
jgi:hypothetical protein